MTDYPYEEIIERARKGRKSIYPTRDETSRFSVFGADIYGKSRRFPTLDDILLAPPQFTPHRLEKSYDLIFREPFYRDVNTDRIIGGFKTTLPIIQASMGSPEDWNVVSTYSARACAELGLIYGIGENVAATWGYDTRTDPKQPSLMDRILTYFEHRKEGYGGVVIQQNEEDATSELWNRLYSDPRITDFMHEGLIAFEIKAGQGAKSGIGGEKIVDRDTALRLQDKGYIIYPDPEVVEQESYERHSSPDIFTADIIKNRILKLRNDYPRTRIWLKTGPYRDLSELIRVAAEAGVDALVVDGKEGGTGMSPTASLQHLGLPTLSCLHAMYQARKEGITTSFVLSGRISEGSQVVKALALGADGVALGRPFLIAANSYPLAKLFVGKEFYKSKIIKRLARFVVKPSERSVQYISNYIETLRLEIQLLVSSLGKYSLDLLSDEDVISTEQRVAQVFGLKDSFGPLSTPQTDIDLIDQRGYTEITG
ncbi:MAG: glutamate synthase-related protein [Candidatus Kariarchaeaceae archaeon]|jgi:hypothetical protein